MLASGSMDTVLFFVCSKYHETEKSAQSTDFLQDHNVSEEVIAKLNNCIIATQCRSHQLILLNRYFGADLFSF